MASPTPHRSVRSLSLALLRDQGGASAVEFAMTAPILFLMVAGSLDMAQGFLARTRANRPRLKGHNARPLDGVLGAIVDAIKDGRVRVEVSDE